MTRRVVLLHLAQADMRAIRQRHRAGVESAGLLLLDVGAKLLQLQTLSESAPAWLNGTRKATVLTHSVVYAVEPDAVLVLGVLPSRADEQLRWRALQWRTP